MAGEAIRDIFHLLETTRTRQVQLTTSERTQKEMARLPSHLIDDVNARGLPLDHHRPDARPSVKKAYGIYKLYSFD